jgi:hypothetical protein
MLWVFDAQSTCQGVNSNLALDAVGLLVIGCKDGSLMALDVGSNATAVPPLVWQTVTDHNVDVTPVIAGPGAVFIASGTRMLALV